MKKILIILSIFFSLNSNANDLSIDIGSYYAYWLYGGVNDYKISTLMDAKPKNISGGYYFINNENSESNNEVYMLVKKTGVSFFYKHDEIEGGPSIGWANATLSNNKLVIDTPTVRNFYDDTDGDADRNIKYKIGVEFSGNNRPVKDKEIIPLVKINSSEFKVDCLSYFNENVSYNGGEPPKDDPMKDYSKEVLLNNNGLCNLVLDGNKDEKIKDGWILFRKID